jgi:hypothetical protein
MASVTGKTRPANQGMISLSSQSSRTARRLLAGNNALSNFANRKYAHKNAVFGLAKKTLYLALGRRSRQFGKDIRIDKITVHKGISLPVS